MFYKHSRAKQYLKDGRALRIETVINDAYDIGCQRLLRNLDDLQTKARAINQRLLDTEWIGQGTVLASPAFARIAQLTVTDDGRRAPASGSATLGSRPWVRSPRMGRKPAHWTTVDRHYEALRVRMQALFNDLGIAAGTVA